MRLVALVLVVIAGGAAVALPATASPAVSRAGAPCRPTASDGPGPFGRGGAAPVRSVFGSGFALRGRVLRSLDCRPLAGAVVELWQAGKGGVYDRRGRAGLVTGRNGGFAFRGPFPAAYEGVGPHIHLRVSHDGYDEVTATVRVRRGQRGASVEIVLASTL